MKLYKYNLVASWLLAAGIVMLIGGFIIGLVVGGVEMPNNDTYLMETVFLWEVAIIYWVSFGVGGLFFIGLAEIVELLSRIHLEVISNREKESESAEINQSI